MPTDPAITHLALNEFTQLVNGALKNYQSVLALARSPLADSALVHPLLVLDDVSPTADERGHALRLLLQWAVTRLAPDSPTYPLGIERAYDDPTWREPHWWRYNILRHRYLEPLHPDEFIDGGRFTETLIALTGITSGDAFFDERNRAIREVAQRLREQLAGGEANVELQTLALEEVLRPLQRDPGAMALLEIAATFDDVFPRSLLLHMATAERLDNPRTNLDALTANRYLLMGDGGVNLWLSPVLQQAVYTRQGATERRHRHRAAADFYRQEGEVLKAADHAMRAQDWIAAATLLLNTAAELIDDLQTDELLAILAHFHAEALPPRLWSDLQLLACDLYRRQGQHGAALAACRQALRTATDDQQQGQLYWRMGKLYEKRNALQALGYYERALTHFGMDDPTVIELLKDRGWLYILRHEWQAAEDDLQRALLLVANHAAQGNTSKANTSKTNTGKHNANQNNELHANLLDALAHLHLEQGEFATAIDYARQSLHLRETGGDPLQMAKSFNNLGNFYSRMGEVDAAIAAHDEALQLYQSLHNQELEAETWLNQGVVYHVAARQSAAIEKYHHSLAISQRLGLLLAEVTAHANLVEAHAELGEVALAEQHWRFGYALSKRADFGDETRYLEELRERFGLHGSLSIQPQVAALSQTSTNAQSVTPRSLLTPDEVAVVALAESEPYLTPKLIMARHHVSKATATRRLTGLTEAGLLMKQGKGRGTVYISATTVATAINGGIGVGETGVGETGVGETGTGEPMTRLGQVAQSKAQSGTSFHDLIGPHLARMQREFQVTEVVLVRAPGQDGVVWQCGVGFQKPPTLAHFFALEQALCTWCGEPVDLVPLEVVEEWQISAVLR